MIVRILFRTVFVTVSFYIGDRGFLQRTDRGVWLIVTGVDHSIARYERRISKFEIRALVGVTLDRLMTLCLKELLDGHSDHPLQTQPARNFGERLTGRAESRLSRRFNTLEVVVTHARSPLIRRK